MKRILIINCRKTFRFFAVILVLSFVIPGLTIAQKSDTNKPKVKIEVKKECDEKGNVIKYDSSYTYSWTFRGDSINIDSTFKHSDMFFKFFSFDDNDFFADTFKFPETPSFPDLNQFYIFRFNDSSLTWHNDIDSLFDQDFNNFLYNHDFSPFDPGDSIFLWPDIFRYPFPHSFLDELDRYIDEMKKFFEDNNRDRHFYYDPTPQKYYKHYKHDKPGTAVKSTEI